MKENEQIQEMAREMCHLRVECKTCEICNEKYHGDDEPCYFQIIAQEIKRFIATHNYRKVERGEWEKTCVPDVYQCTNCKRPTKMDMFCDSEVLRAFCPNCGADMRGNDND